jgi:hypothetical protein
MSPAGVKPLANVFLCRGQGVVGAGGGHPLGSVGHDRLFGCGEAGDEQAVFLVEPDSAGRQARGG